MKKISLLFIFHILYASLAYSNTSINKLPIVFSKAERINKYTTRIPVKLIDHLIVVEAQLNQQKGNFIIDTGSEALILNKKHFSKHLFSTNKTENRYGILNEVNDSFEKTFKKFSLKDFSYENKKSDIIDLSHIEKSKKIRLLGIIGYDVLKDYEIFIDLFLNQITLTKTDKKGNRLHDKVYLEQIVDTLDFKLKNHAINLKGTINKQNLNFILDSGAELNQLNKDISKKALRSFYPKRRVKLTGASNRKIEVITGNLFRLKLSEHTYLGPMKTMLTNLTKMNEAFGTKADGILGYEFLVQKRTIINYKKEKLYIIAYPLVTQ